MKKNYCLKLIGIFLLFFTLSCQKNDVDVIEPKNERDVSSMITFLSKSLSVDKASVLYDSRNDVFTIGGDMKIKRIEVEKYMALKPSKSKENKISHYRTPFIVSSTYVSDIKVFVDASVPSDWQDAVTSAIGNWNAINAKVQLRQVSDVTISNIVVSLYYEDSNVVARAYIPTSDGKPGFAVEINTKFNSLSNSRKIFTMTHEIGHTIGFGHTDHTVDIFITGTSTTDPNSVMNSVLLDWNGFTSGDVNAIRILYPFTTYSYTFGPNSWSATYQYQSNFNTTINYYLQAGNTANNICAIDGTVTGGIYSRGSLCQ